MVQIIFCLEGFQMILKLLSVIGAFILAAIALQKIDAEGGDIFALLGCLVKLFWYGFLFVIAYVLFVSMFFGH